MNPPRPLALLALFAAVAALGPAGAQAQSIDLPPRPGYNPPRPPAPPPAAPRPVVAPSSASAADGAQHVEVQGVAPPAAGRARTGAYSVKFENERVVTVRCLEGGTVVVSKSSLDRVAGSTPQARRDTGLRQSCRDIDFTK